MSSRDVVVYQIYPRSFQDSNGDGIGDLPGIAGRLDYLTYLGVDALWLSPIYPSPLADFGYDVADYTNVDPVFGSLADLDALVAEAHARGLRLLLDLVPSHTSIEHPWFRAHPDRYIWSPVDGPPNNWRSAFGGSAWERDPVSGRWYLHTFFPEQADLDWRNRDVVEAMQQVVRFWLDRGVDGYRVDAVNSIMKDAELRDDPPATGEFPLPLDGDFAELDHVYSSNRREVVDALAALRAAAGEALLVGEVYLPTREYAPYLEHLDRVFGFELYFSPWRADRLRAAIGPAVDLGGIAWVLSNHDFARLRTRLGEENVRAAAVVLLTLPGPAFVYQGDEIGLGDGPGAQPPHDRHGRDPHRHPMQWDGNPNGGFTAGTPWLPTVDPQERNVADQMRDDGSLLQLYRRLIALRPELGDSFELLDSAPGVLAYARGGAVVAVNTTAEPQPAPRGSPLLESERGVLDGGRLAPHAAAIVERGE